MGSPTSGLLLPGDFHYFRVTVNSEGVLTAYTTGSTDTYGYLSDGSGTTLDENDDGAAGGNFLVFGGVASGTYYIWVRGDAAFTAGSYTLHVEKEALVSYDNPHPCLATR